jgi:spoIIIJ-associated protein
MDGALFVEDDERAGGPRDERAEGTRDERPHKERRPEDDEKADDARRVTQSILDRMDLDARVTIREDDERVVLDIDGPDAGRAIGKKGMTLEALQFLVNKIVNRDPDERRHIVLDSGDYRDRHDSGLVAMAKREAKRALSSGRAVTLEPMSARDRRVIHVSLAKFPGISTRSEGEGTDRRLQIIPARGGGGGRERDERPREHHRGPSRDARPRAPEGRPAPLRDARDRGAPADRPPRARQPEAEPGTVVRERELDVGHDYDNRERDYSGRDRD